MQFVQIHVERIYDLFAVAGSRDVALPLREDKVRGVYVEGATTMPAANVHECLALVERGSQALKFASTQMNRHSSRSHAICRIGIQRAGEERGKAGSLTLVDLAGSEQRIDTDKHDARRTKESAHINSSLMSLKDSVRALARGEEFGQLAGRSALTKVLKASFTGTDAQTLVLATASPNTWG